MKLIAQVKLLPTPEQTDALKQTLELTNEACNYLSERAWETNTFRQYALHTLAYYETRAQFPELSSQIVVRCTARVADAYKLDRKSKRRFKSLSAIAYDDRILHWYIKKGVVSIWTVNGREKIPYACGQRQCRLLKFRQGQSDLILRHGEFYLHAVCNIEEPDLIEPEGILGVDLGIVNIATDSDGETHSGESVERNRRIYTHRRRNLQRRGTKAAKRKLKQISGKQTNFQRNTNHTISKHLVKKAQDTHRAIAIENLAGIRSRITVRRKQRARHANWSFYQLKQFIAYKARLAGIPLLEVDPRNTSRTCPVCGCIDKHNRRTQSLFSCIHCGYSAPADINAAVIIAARAAVNQPMVSTMASAIVSGTNHLL